MKFVVSSQTLLNQLNALYGVVTTNPVVPILENFLFELGDNSLVITASDLQTSIVAEMTVESKSSVSICVPAKLLIDTLKNLPEQPVTFTIDENTYSIELSSDNGRYKLAGENATDFPRIPAVKNGFSVNVSSDVLAQAISCTMFATSSDDMRPAMTGVYFSLGESYSTFAATDGHRLVRYRRVDVTSDSGMSIIIPRKALSLLEKSLPKENANIEVEFNPSNAYFSFNNIKMICRLIDERFPDFENAIPLDNPNILTIDKAELISSLKRIQIYANKTTHQVRLKISGSELQISAEDLDFSNEANERLACEYSGEDMEIGFNSKLLIEVLNNITPRMIKLNMSTPSRAGIITPLENGANEDLLMLVMPVLLNSVSA